MSDSVRTGGLVRNVEVMLKPCGCVIPIDLRGADHTEVKVHLVVDIEAFAKAIADIARKHPSIRRVLGDKGGHSASQSDHATDGSENAKDRP